MASKARIKPPGATTAERDAISLGRIESFLDGIIEGKMQCPSCQKEYQVKDLDRSCLAAIEARYDKLRPTLSAVEMQQPDPLEGVSRPDMIARLRLLLQDPSIARELGIDVPKPQPVVSAINVHTQQASDGVS